jgi:hypothetical protein
MDTHHFSKSTPEHQRHRHHFQPHHEAQQRYAYDSNPPHWGVPEQSVASSEFVSTRKRVLRKMRPGLRQSVFARRPSLPSALFPSLHKSSAASVRVANTTQYIVHGESELDEDEEEALASDEQRELIRHHAHERKLRSRQRYRQQSRQTTGRPQRWRKSSQLAASSNGGRKTSSVLILQRDAITSARDRSPGSPSSSTASRASASAAAADSTSVPTPEWCPFSLDHLDQLVIEV